MSTTEVAQRLKETWETPKTLWGWFATVDHKEIGIRYLVTAMAFLIVGGLEALVMRIQLARPNMALLTPEMYDQLFTHARPHHDFLVCPAHPFRIRRLSHPADDRRARHGVPAAECLHLLGLSALRHPGLYRAVHGAGAARGLVRLHAVHQLSVFALVSAWISTRSRSSSSPSPRPAAPSTSSSPSCACARPA